MMTDTIESTAPPVIRYRTMGGAIVRVIEVERRGDPDQWDHEFVAQCAGCLDTEGSTAYPQDIERARTWAAQHARECAALPPVDAEQPPVSAAYLAVARQSIDRAIALAQDNETGKRKADLLANIAQSATALAVAAHRIDGV